MCAVPSAPHRIASWKVGAPIGAIMNSWMSTLESAWAPPLRMFNIGTASNDDVYELVIHVASASPTLDRISLRLRRLNSSG